MQWNTRTAVFKTYCTVHFVTQYIYSKFCQRLPMQATGSHNGGWLAWHDRKALYNAQLCTVAIIKVGGHP